MNIYLIHRANINISSSNLYIPCGYKWVNIGLKTSYTFQIEERKTCILLVQLALQTNEHLKFQTSSYNKILIEIESN
jgi:hypothetical protein